MELYLYPTYIPSWHGEGGDYITANYVAFAIPIFIQAFECILFELRVPILFKGSCDYDY